MENQPFSLKWKDNSQMDTSQKPQIDDEEVINPSWDWKKQELDPLHINTEPDFSELDNNITLQ